MKFFKENLLDPFAIGIRDLTITKQKMADEYSALRKKSKDIDLSKNVEGTPFNNNHAVRVFLWEKAGFEIPNISEAQKKTLVDLVNNNSMKSKTTKLFAIPQRKCMYLARTYF